MSPSAHPDSAPPEAPLKELLEDSPVGEWVQDPLSGCVRMTLPLGEDFEGPVSATLVRFDGDPEIDPPLPVPSRPPVLQIHGWSDYFYNQPLARQWVAAGHPFYALELRKYGRSLRGHQTPGHIDDLAEYDQEIHHALAVLIQENPELGLPIISAHSTGGLVAALWAERHPEAIQALVLNAPWLELPGHSPARAAAEGLLAPLKAVNPTTALKLPRPENYWESLSDEANGEWSLHPLWRPRQSFPMTVGWLKAVFAGHRRVHEGLDLSVPVLVLLSTATVYRSHWTEEYQERDGVLDVELLARRAVKLGRLVTVVRVPQAMHDVFASRQAVRDEAFQHVLTWLKAYG